MQAKKIWKWLDSHEHGTITVQIMRAGGEPVLRNLCEALNRKLKDTETFEHENNQPIIDAFDRVLGIPEQNLVWIYLNKGTHHYCPKKIFLVFHNSLI